MAIDVDDGVLLDPDRDPDSRNYLIRGRWLSTFQGHIQDNPDFLPTASGNSLPPAPAQLGVFNPRTPSGFTQVDGFYVFAALADITFGFEKAVTGGIHLNLGKDHQVLMGVTGTYDCRMGRLSAVQGEFEWILAGEGYAGIGMKGHFVLTRANELTWVVIGASRPGSAVAPRIVSGGRMYRAP
jgi:hypothetical protein